ncbi:hypothetical protein NDU88_002784 [Pleurodeles waltl]|uniref:Uncharacterized protein n=1 Tax=Pleurodeles waltl TaxID=8319 RepID=A0AAV7UC79_PLEWA|nr:hypothetical protein NDU88_002784 [Pleurodeles waltl]
MDDMSKPSGKGQVRKLPARYRDDCTARVRAVGGQMKEATEEKHQQPELDDDLEELLRRARELLARECRGMGGKTDATPPEQVLAKRQQTGQEKGAEKQSMQGKENSAPSKGTGWLQPEQHPGAPKGVEAQRSSDPPKWNHTRVSCIRGMYPPTPLESKGTSKGSINDDLEAEQSRVPREMSRSSHRSSSRAADSEGG